MNTDKMKSKKIDKTANKGPDIKDELNRIIDRAKSENEALQKVLVKMKENNPVRNA